MEISYSIQMAVWGQCLKAVVHIEIIEAFSETKCAEGNFSVLYFKRKNFLVTWGWIFFHALFLKILSSAALTCKIFQIFRISFYVDRILFQNTEIHSIFFFFIIRKEMGLKFARYLIGSSTFPSNTFSPSWPC